MSITTVAVELRPVPWTVFTDEVMRLYQPPMRRRTTREKTRQVLREFGRLCPSTADLSELAIAGWISDHRHRAPSSVEGLLRHLSAVCTYGAHPRRRYLWDPFEDRPVSSWLPGDELDQAEPFRRHRSAEEVRRVLDQADREALAGPWRAVRLRAVVWTLAYTGGHKSEVLGLRIADLDLGRGMIAFRSHGRRRLKARSRAAVLPVAGPLRPVLAGYLVRLVAEHPRTEWLFPHAFGTGPWLSGRPGHSPLDSIRALGERAGVEGLTIDAFRHTLATHAEDWGISELALMRILRHARRTTQLHYRHPDLDLMRGAISRITY